MPTDFDWRVGVLDGKPLFVCRYYMARGHWQIYHHGESGSDGGRERDDRRRARAARRAQSRAAPANPIGNGLYGVDIKTAGGQVLIEVNDNPSIDAASRTVLGDELYPRVMKVLRRESMPADKSNPRAEPP